ncbi:hypothetical protein ACIRSU_16525 [Streptomyces sp. NPDC101160]|uniref:hypothetical protein n=1 Tax=Streptomyces sp. NPDC101160 TaxID=3366118 RepID=UPI00380C19F4
MQPQQPYAAPADASAQTISAPPRGRTKAVVLALVAGLAVGAAGTGVAWALSAEAAPAGGTPEADARAACQALDGFDETKFEEKGAAGDVAINRFAAAGALSASAAAGDPTYKPLAEAIRRSQELHAQVFTFDAKVKKELNRARAICADL